MLDDLAPVPWAGVAEPLRALMAEVEREAHALQRLVLHAQPRLTTRQHVLMNTTYHGMPGIRSGLYSWRYAVRVGGRCTICRDVEMLG